MDISWQLALAGFIFGIYHYRKSEHLKKQEKFAELEAEDEFKHKKQAKRIKTAEELLRATLTTELGSISMFGSPDIENISVDLDDAFVLLHISETWRSEKRFDPREALLQLIERYSTPEKVMQRAFKNFRMLLIIGDPGSGKTTLMKFYAMRCLKNQYEKLGFTQPVLPIYLPLVRLQWFSCLRGCRSPPVL